MKKLSYIFLIVMSFLVINNVSAEEKMVVCSYKNEFEEKNQIIAGENLTQEIYIYYDITRQTNVVYNYELSVKLYDDRVVSYGKGIAFDRTFSIRYEGTGELFEISGQNELFDCPDFGYYAHSFYGEPEMNQNAICYDNNGECEAYGSFSEKSTASNLINDYQSEIDNQIIKVNNIIDEYKKDSSIIANLKENSDEFQDENYSKKIISEIYSDTYLEYANNFPVYATEYLKVKLSMEGNVEELVSNFIISSLHSFWDDLIEAVNNNPGIDSVTAEKLVTIITEEKNQLTQNFVTDNMKDYLTNVNGEDYYIDDLIGEAFDDCASLLGESAKWFQLILDIMKYVAITALVILSIMDFLKSVAAQDNDALNKAFKTVTLRLVYTVIIFFIPIILNFAFTLVGIYPSDDCLENANPVVEEVKEPDYNAPDGTGIEAPHTAY